MVPGAVELQYSIFPPARPLQVQKLDQMEQEHHHHVLVGVGLREAVVNIALGVQCCDQ